VAAGERLVQRDAEAKLVGPGVDEPALVLLRGHVRRRPRARVATSGRVVPDDAGEPEVDDPDARRPPSPRQIRTFSGLKSRCTTPASCAAARPRPACTNTSRICADEPRSRSQARSVTPSMYSIAT
jgi:hypothetical protein